LALYA